MRYEEVPDPAPGAGEVLLEIGLCGICGSDLHLYDSPMAGDGLVLGHEFGATVVECGPGVSGWEPGDRVVATMLEPCGNCWFCRRGEQDLCYQHRRIEMQRSGRTEGGLGSGGYGRFTRSITARLMRIPDALDDRQAACVEPAAVGYHAVRKSGMAFGDRVAILGAGPIGLFTLQCAREAGASRIVVVEPAAHRARVAAQLGADTVLDPRGIDAIATAIADAAGRPPDTVFDAAGVPATLQQAVDAVRPGGHVMMVGVSFENAPVRPSSWVTKRVTVRAAFAYSRADYAATIDLLERRRIDVGPLISSVVPASDLPAVFDRMLGPNTEIKVLVDPRA
jgi:(R,R)-butanediol dehydrogenase/meso-butanediol dehydrogenase/diacetyl reductase